MPTAAGFSDRVNAIDRNAHSVVSPGLPISVTLSGLDRRLTFASNLPDSLAEII
jgi:hypothetical protein